MQWLFKIEDVFDITERGCVLAPGIPYSLGLDVKAGASLTVVTPSGEHVRTRIASFESFHRRNQGLTHAAFAVGREVEKVQLAIGSDVFLDE